MDIEVFSDRDVRLISEELGTMMADNFTVTKMDPESIGYSYNANCPQFSLIEAYYRGRRWKEIPKIEFD